MPADDNAVVGPAFQLWRWLHYHKDLSIMRCTMACILYTRQREHVAVTSHTCTSVGCMVGERCTTWDYHLAVGECRTIADNHALLQVTHYAMEKLSCLDGSVLVWHP
eukprot:1850827-Amphidinium_carterae.1